MYHHRYGRHGPDAWKRRHLSRFQQRLPAIASTVAVVRIQTPVNAERIIFIVVTSPGNPEGFERNEPILIQREQSLSLQPVIDNSPLAKRARIRAVDDIEDIKTRIEKEGPVTILDEYVHKRAMILAKEEVKNSYSPDDPPDPDEYRRLVERWKSSYLEQLEKERKVIANDLKSFPDTKAANLARKAREDRRKYLWNFLSVVARRGSSLFHQKDSPLLDRSA